MKTIHINNQLFLERIVNYNFNNLGVFIPLEFINSLNDLTSNILNNNDSLLNDYLEMFYYYEQNISNNIYLTESNKEFLDLINNVFIVFYKHFNIEKQITNPILPNFEYTPDIEPKVFNDRVYLYGSHDKFNGNSFCINDYITYSANINDLSNWRYEGIIYKRANDPNYKKGRMSAMFAPDVIKGLDNKYYLYYHLGFSGRIGVAVSDKPNTMFSFLGYVKYSDGSLLGSKKEPLQFDPGIFIDDDNKIYLYTGFAPKKFNLFLLKNKKTTKEGAMVFELESDMLTIKTNFKYIAKTVFNSTNSSFYGHEFFEAASMRKIDDTYYFIYSSILGHELCYATSKYPNKDFKFGGTLVSNGDLGLTTKPLNYLGNNHGSLLTLNNKHYIFYHRQTNRNSFQRQAAVEPLEFINGKFIQSEITSQGLNNKPLRANYKYSSAIVANLYSTRGVYFYKVFKKRSKHHPYLTQFGKDRNDNPNQHISNFSKYAVATYKYFNFDFESYIELEIISKATGKIMIYANNDLLIGSINIDKKSNLVKTEITKLDGTYSITFKFIGKGNFKLLTLKFLK